MSEYRLEDGPRLVSVDTPEDEDALVRMAWRLTNVAWNEMGDVRAPEDHGMLTKDGLHTMILHALLQLREDGIEKIMNDLENQEPRP